MTTVLVLCERDVELCGCCFQVKHKEVADFLGGRLYDCVIKFNEAIP
jgi:hypothetical protein